MPFSGGAGPADMPDARGNSPGAPTGRANGNYRSIWTKEWLELRRQVSELRRGAKAIVG